MNLHDIQLNFIDRSGFFSVRFFFAAKLKIQLMS